VAVSARVALGGDHAPGGLDARTHRDGGGARADNRWLIALLLVKSARRYPLPRLTCATGFELHSRRLAAQPAHLLVLLAGTVETDPESLDFAEPAAIGGFPDPLVQVGDDLGKPYGLDGVGSQHRAAQAAFSCRQGEP